MIISGFTRKQLPPAPPEVEAAAHTTTATKEDADVAANAIEMYLALGVTTKAFLIGGKLTLVQSKFTGVH